MTKNYTPNPNSERPDTSTYPPILQFGTEPDTYAPQEDAHNRAQPSPKPPNFFGVTGFVIAILCVILSLYIFSKLAVVFVGEQIEIENDYFTIWLFLTGLSFVFSVTGIIVSKRLNGSGFGLSVAGIAISVSVFFIGITTLFIIAYVGLITSFPNWL